MKHLGMILFFGGMLVGICCGAKLTEEAVKKAEWDHNEGEKKQESQKQAAEMVKAAEEKGEQPPDVKIYEPVKFTFQGETKMFPSTFPIFCVSIAAAIAGVAAWRMDATGKHEAAAKAKGDDPISLLSKLHHELAQIQKQVTELSTPELIRRIDSVIDNLIFPFNQVRNSILTRYGMGYGAEILVTFAGAERSLNRAWSAASDDHREEAVSAFASAAQGFAHTDELAQKKLV